MAAEPKCPHKGCEHPVAVHTARAGCTAPKKGHGTGKVVICPCTRTW